MYSVQSYPVGNHDDMKRRAIFFPFFHSPRPTFTKQTHGGWIRGPTNQSFTFHADHRYPLLPRPRPLTNFTNTLTRHIRHLILTSPSSSPRPARRVSLHLYDIRGALQLNRIFFWVERIFRSSKQHQNPPSLPFPSSTVIEKDDIYFLFFFSGSSSRGRIGID